MQQYRNMMCTYVYINSRQPQPPASLRFLCDLRGKSIRAVPIMAASVSTVSKPFFHRFPNRISPYLIRLSSFPRYPTIFSRKKQISTKLRHHHNFRLRDQIIIEDKIKTFTPQVTTPTRSVSEDLVADAASVG